MQSIAEIKGHPSLEGESVNGRKAVRITVCSNCERLRSILFLSQDRWFCTSCRAEGAARPTQVFYPNPSKRS